MISKKLKNPWLWIPCLFAAEEIPSAVVIFVALLMFLQFGASETMASVYSGLLFLPWVLKSYFYTKVRKTASYRWRITVVELLMFACLMQIAFYLTDFRVRDWVLFLMMFALSFLCAWHELLSRLYYNKMLMPREQRFYGNVKMLASQISLVMTYGLLIIVAGFFEVFFRSYQKAWAMESSLVAGGFLVFCALNVLVLQNPRHQEYPRHESLMNAMQHEWRVVERIRQKPQVVRVLLCLFLLLLPQALMFNTRVFFLLAEADRGGLFCSVQDVGFAQGTIGVIAFSIGLGLGRFWMNRYGHRKMFWSLAFALTLSPLSYMLMSHEPQPGNLLLICCMTFLAQFLFGIGLNICGIFVRYISGQRYRTTINYLYVPVVAGAMLVPLMLSGWLCTELGYRLFFTVCVGMAPVAWLLTQLLGIKNILIENERDL